MENLSRRDFLKTAAMGGLLVSMGIAGLGITGCSKKKGPSGKATAVAQGKNGDVSVTVTVEDGKITAVDIVGKNEVPTIGGVAIEEMPQQIIAAQSFEVDGVAGATVTSDAIKQAGEEAFSQIKDN